MHEQRRPCYDFGPFRIDTVKRLLRRDGKVVSLTPKTFDTLLALVENAGKVMEKTELMRHVWPDSFVEEGNLTYHISLLRKAMGESPNEHRYIVTIPGRGYRFVADVRWVGDESAELVVQQHIRSILTIEKEIETDSKDEDQADAGLTRSQSDIIKGQSPKRDWELERNGGHALQLGSNNEQASIETAQRLATSATAAGANSSAASLIRQLVHQRRVGIFAIVALVVTVTAALFLYFNRKPALAEADNVMLADFVNTTGDTVFDGTLKLALSLHLEQSPYLNIFSDQQVRETLRYMNRSPESPVTREVAREVCERQGIKALLSGSIAPLGSHYVIALEAVNAHTGEVIARQQLEAESKEQVLRTLGKAATKLREKLGESLRSIQKFDAHEDQATTSSLEAFKAYILGDEQMGKDSLGAIPFFERAIELDPKFAMAYRRLAFCYFNIGKRELAIGFAKKAFALREQVSERERLSITQFYYLNVEGDQDKATEVLEMFKQMYPHNFVPYNNLAGIYLNQGQYEKALEEAREAFRLLPQSAFTHVTLALTLTQLNRFEEAKEIIKQAQAQKKDHISLHQALYKIAFVQGDAATMKEQLDWASEKQNEHEALNWQAWSAAFGGQVRRSHEFTERAIASAQRRRLEKRAAVFAAEAAQRNAVFGNCRQTRAEVSRALVLARDLEPMRRSASALALCGEGGQAQSLVDELTKQFPKHTFVNMILSPIVQAEMELYRGHPTQVIQLLQSNHYEGASDYWFPYLRGQAYLLERAGAEAAAEFQKILDHWGWDPLSTLYPLAHLGLARAAALTGDKARSRKAYEDFLTLWKDADADLLLLRAAKQEYAKLHQ